MGLKLIAFDTTGSGTLNPSGFIVLAFLKVGLCFCSKGPRDAELED